MCDPVQILQLKKSPPDKTEYILKYNELEKYLEPFNDKPVAIIPIVGPSRKGKSFILNYMVRYLSRYPDNNWLGEKDEPLQGFHWKSDIKPQTTGIWLSKPFIVKRSDDTEIVVLLIDTQGVYDPFLTEKDWSTIVGISLLLSSCLIFNVTADLQEDILTSLETYLKYGLEAAKAQDGQGDKKVFQKMFFLIRDWQNAHQFSYGIKGGKQFLEDKFKIEEHHTEQAKKNRELLKNTIQDIECFLMPNIGEKAVDGFSDGRTDHLNPTFIRELPRLIDHLLNPDEIDLKIINGKKVTCGEILHYFQSYVEVFNGDKLPTPESLKMATAKVSYTINRDKILKKHRKNLEKIIGESFIPIKDFEKNNQAIQSNYIEELEKSSCFNKNEENLVYEKFKKNYQDILDKLVNQRKKIMNECLDKSIDSYNEILKSKTENKYIDLYDLDNILQESRDHIMSEFEKTFNGEEKEVFKEDLSLIQEKMNKIDKTYKDYNKKIKNEMNTKYKEISEQIIKDYNEIMNKLINEKVILDERSFKNYEKSLREKEINSYQNKVNESGIPCDENVQGKLIIKLKERRNKYKTNFHEIHKMVTTNVNERVNMAVEEYERSMAEVLNNNPNETLILNKHKFLKNQVMSQFLQNCLTKDDTFLKPFVEILVEKLDQIYKRNIESVKNQQQSYRDQYKIEASNMKDMYIQEMDNLTLKQIPDEEFKRHHIRLRGEIVNKYQDMFRNRIGLDPLITQQVFELRDVLDIEFENLQESNILKRDKFIFEEKTKELIQFYENNLNNCKENNESAINSKHEEITKRVINEIQSLKPSSRKFNTKLYQDNLSKATSEIFQNSIKIFRESKNKQMDFEKLLERMTDNYDNKMKILFGGEKCYLDSSLENFHQKYKRDTINKFKIELGNFPGEYYQQTYNTKSLQYIEECFQNYMKENQERRNVKDQFIEKIFKEYIEVYEFEMGEYLPTVESDGELKALHEKLEANYINKLKNRNNILEPGLQIHYLTEFKNMLELSYNRFHAITNNNEIKKRINEAKHFYNKKMKEFMETNENYSKNNLYNNHETSRKQSNLYLKSKLGDLLNIEKFISELNIEIEKEFEKLNENLNKKGETDKKQLEFKVMELSLDFENTLSKSLVDFQTEEDFNAKHKTLKKEILDKFITQNKTTDKTILNSFRSQLEEKIEKSIKESKERFKGQLESNKRILKAMQMDVRQTYKDEMEKFTKGSPYLSNDKLKECNETVIKLLYDRHNKGKGNMADEKYMKLIKDSVKDIFNKIKDINAMNIPVSPAIGIDLGTTNCCVAYYKKNQVTIIPNEFRRNTTPSFVSLREGEEVVGDVAKQDFDPRNTIHSVKRLIGREMTDPSVVKYLDLISYKVIDDDFNNPKISVRVDQGLYRDQKTYYPEEISTMLLKKLKNNAETYLNCPVTKAVITVPAYFNDAQKGSTKDAGRLAGLEVLKIINEPTASAVAYSLHQKDDIYSRNVLIYDFGGGTFDVAVLHVERGKISVKSVGGDNNLGGDDIDNTLMEFCLKKFQDYTHIELEGPEKFDAIWRLRQKCEELKCKLSSIESTGIKINRFFNEQDLDFVITRKKFEEINANLFQRSMDLVDMALNEANVEHSDIDDIVLVGGTTRIPKIRDMLSKKFNGRPLNHYLDPDEVVARGAAIQAAILNGQQAGDLNLVLSDVTPMSLGIAVGEDVMNVILPRNTPVPCSKRQEYQIVAGQIIIKVYEGEHQLCSQNNMLGSFILNALSGVTDEQSVGILVVTFTVNDEGLLHVSAKISFNGQEIENSVRIKEYRGHIKRQQSFNKNDDNLSTEL